MGLSLAESVNKMTDELRMTQTMKSMTGDKLWKSKNAKLRDLTEKSETGLSLAEFENEASGDQVGFNNQNDIFNPDSLRDTEIVTVLDDRREARLSPGSKILKCEEECLRVAQLNQNICVTVTVPDDMREASTSPRCVPQVLSPGNVNLTSDAECLRVRQQNKNICEIVTLPCTEESPRVAQLNQKICENNCEKKVARRELNLSEMKCNRLYLCETPPRVALLSQELQTLGNLIVSLETALSENEWYNENSVNYVSNRSVVEELEIFTISEKLLEEILNNIPAPITEI